MKKSIIISVLMLLGIVVLSSCNNGNVKKDVINAVESAKFSYDSLENHYYNDGMAFAHSEVKKAYKRRFRPRTQSDCEQFKKKAEQLEKECQVDANNFIVKTFAPLLKKYDYDEIRNVIVEILGKTNVPEDEYVFIHKMKEEYSAELTDRWLDGFKMGLNEYK